MLAPAGTRPIVSRPFEEPGRGFEAALPRRTPDIAACVVAPGDALVLTAASSLEQPDPVTPSAASVRSRFEDSDLTDNKVAITKT